MPHLHIFTFILYHHITTLCKGKLRFVPQRGGPCGDLKRILLTPGSCLRTGSFSMPTATGAGPLPHPGQRRGARAGPLPDEQRSQPDGPGRLSAGHAPWGAHHPGAGGPGGVLSGRGGNGHRTDPVCGRGHCDLRGRHDKGPPTDDRWPFFDCFSRYSPWRSRSRRSRRCFR